MPDNSSLSRPVQGPLLTELLRAVSRSFYLTLRVLPGAIRPQISLAYLLARTSDTIADTDLLPVEDRLSGLGRLSQRIEQGARGPKLDLGAFVSGQKDSAEAILLRRAEESVTCLETFASEDRQRIREVLRTIISGQELDLKRFGQASAEWVASLERGEELEDYTYRVAGCVGEFWTALCREHLFPRAKLDLAALMREGVAYGQGLQLTNILRDLSGDLRQGRCYLPREELARAGVEPQELLNAEVWARAKPVSLRWLTKAEGHLRMGWVYTNRLPARQLRLRLACAWPILIGMETLGKMRSANLLDPVERVKIDRREVRRILARSLWRLPWPKAWKELPRTLPSVHGKPIASEVISK